jgi:membrane-associated phospholipid phosphatase
MTRPRRLLAAAALAALSVVAVASTSIDASPGQATVGKPWHLTSVDQFRLHAPPTATSPTTKKELAELRRLQAKRTPQTVKTIKKWNAGAAVNPWTDLLFQAILNYRPRPPLASYRIAIFLTGLHDAVAAAYDSRQAYAAESRPAPSKLDRRIKPALKNTAGSTYASPEAAVAGAAETLLPYLFPEAPKSLYVQAATEAVSSRLSAGLNYRTDVQRARLLGQKVAQAVIEHEKTDGRTNTALPYPRRVGEAYWTSTPPTYEPPFGGPTGTWRPWLMSSASQFLNAIPGPSAYGSPAFMNQLLTVVNTVKNETQAQRDTVFFWDDGPGTLTPPGHWISIAEALINKSSLSTRQAARVLAYLAAAEADAAIASWGMKYYYWSIRPITAIWRLCGDGSTLCTEAQVSADQSIAPFRDTWYSVIPTPSFPSYPSGHATFSGAAGRLLGYFFPASAQELTRLAEEAAMSRLYAGIHFPEDNDDGLALGRAVADLAIQSAEASETH